MKKLLLSFLASALIFNYSHAQAIIFTEDFNSTTGVALPTGWTEYNVDNHTVVTNLSTFNFGTHAWVSSADATIGQVSGGRFVVSTSWYTPAGSSDDWLVTPAITLTANNALKWMAKAQDPNYPDGYQVKISTTGNAVADFTTNLLTVPAEAGTWSQRSVDLSAYNGQTVYLAFRNNSNDKFLLAFDDVQVVSLPAVDAAISNVAPAAGTAASYGLVNAVNIITATITNNGSTPITSIDFKYSDGVNTFTDTKTGLNIPTFGTAVISHNTTYSIPSLGSHALTVWVQLSGDVNATNDNSSTEIVGVSFFPAHTVVIEEGTGTWCGWCPRGAVFMDSINTMMPQQTVLIAVHNNDPMTVTAYDAGVSGQIPGYPSVLINRSIVDDPSNIFPQVNSHLNDFGFADITVLPTYNSVTGAMSIDVNTHFAVDLTGDYRIAAVITEDHVSGTTTAYDQHNYYSFQTSNIPLQGAGHNWQNETDPVLAANMEYNHVARALLGGYSGMSGSLPATIAGGSNQTYNFTYTVPSTVNIANVHVNAMLIDATNNRILNGNKNTNVLGIITPDDVIGSFGIAPNPASDLTVINYAIKKSNTVSIAVTNMLGQVVYSDNLGNQQAGSYKVDLNSASLKNGLYSVSLTVGDKKYTQKLSVNN